MKYSEGEEEEEEEEDEDDDEEEEPGSTSDEEDEEIEEICYEECDIGGEDSQPSASSDMEIDDHKLAPDDSERYKEMLGKELRGGRCQFRDDYLRYRSELVEWMTQLGENLGLAALTVHLAVAYVDKAAWCQEIHPTRFQLLAVACILAAAKHDEMESKVPSVHDLNRYCGGIFSAEIICKMELILLNSLGWELMLLTPRHFLELFLFRGGSAVYPDHDSIDNNSISYEKLSLVRRYLRKYSEFFTDLCLQDHTFETDYVPSIVASASIAAARRQLKLTPPWPKHMKQLTGYKFSTIRPCLEHTWSVYQTNFGPQRQP